LLEASTDETSVRKHDIANSFLILVKPGLKPVLVKPVLESMPHEQFTSTDQPLPELVSLISPLTVALAWTLKQVSLVRAKQLNKIQI
jgi:hypothetical protein